MLGQVRKDLFNLQNHAILIVSVNKRPAGCTRTGPVVDVVVL